MIQTWGITDKYSWIPTAFPGEGWGLPWDAAYQKKPAYGAMLESLQ
jgi:endo-1,4-beta-xylanase